MSAFCRTPLLYTNELHKYAFRSNIEYIYTHLHNVNKWVYKKGRSCSELTFSSTGAEKRRRKKPNCW